MDTVLESVVKVRVDVAVVDGRQGVTSFDDLGDRPAIDSGPAFPLLDGGRVGGDTRIVANAVIPPEVESEKERCGALSLVGDVHEYAHRR